MKNKSKIDRLKDFLAEQHVSFETMIRCFNFWEILTPSERSYYVKQYGNGNIPNSGSYGCEYGHKDCRCRK